MHNYQWYDFAQNRPNCQLSQNVCFCNMGLEAKSTLLIQSMFSKKTTVQKFQTSTFNLRNFWFQCSFFFYSLLVKFVYSEKATKFCEIFPLLLTTVHTVKSKRKISQNFVGFSEYMNFKAAVRGHSVQMLTKWDRMRYCI